MLLENLLMLFNRRPKKSSKAPAGPPPSNYPYKTELIQGLLATHNNRPFPTKKVTVTAEMGSETTVVTLRYIFQATYRQADVSFPLSECGSLNHFAFKINDKEIGGSMKTDTTLRPDGGPVYFFIAKDVFAEPLEVGEAVLVTVIYRCKNVKNAKGHICFALPLSCFAIPPTAIQLTVRMEENIRKVICPNRPRSTYVVIDEKNATVMFPGIEEGGGAPIVLSQYLLVVQVELGEPIVPQCADSMTIFILVTAIGMAVFFTLTKDLR